MENVEDFDNVAGFEPEMSVKSKLVESGLCGDDSRSYTPTLNLKHGQEATNGDQ